MQIVHYLCMYILVIFCNDHYCYYLLKTWNNWFEASQQCRRFHSDLVSIRNAAENEWIRTEILVKLGIDKVHIGTSTVVTTHNSIIPIPLVHKEKQKWLQLNNIGVRKKGISTFLVRFNPLFLIGLKYTSWTDGSAFDFHNFSGDVENDLCPVLSRDGSWQYQDCRLKSRILCKRGRIVHPNSNNIYKFVFE